MYHQEQGGGYGANRRHANASHGGGPDYRNVTIEEHDTREADNLIMELLISAVIVIPLCIWQNTSVPLVFKSILSFINLFTGNLIQINPLCNLIQIYIMKRKVEAIWKDP